MKNSTIKNMTWQINTRGEKLTFRLEHPNGAQAQPMLALKHLVKSQDLEAWKGDPEAFKEWIAQSMASYFRNLDVVIWTYQADRMPENINA